MVILAERAIETVLSSAITLFRDNLATFVPDIYAQETTANQSEIQTWWTNANNQVSVQIGYSLSPIKGPQLAITTENSSEIAKERFVGNMQQTNAAGYSYTTNFDGQYAIHVYGPNQNWLYWMQVLVKWALLINRLNLENEYGLMNQRISLSSLRPVPDSQKDVIFPFMRTVFLSCQHMDTWTPLAGSSVSSTSVTLNVQS